MNESQPTSAPEASPVSESQFAVFSKRSLRQLGLYAAGAGFLGLSMAITRRSIIRRYRSTVPKFYQPSNYSTHNVNGGLDAFEALNLATLNVCSVGMMCTGGLMWAFDISSVEDMRKRVRTNLGMANFPRDQEAEEEIEEWVASVLSRKEFKALRGEKGITDEQLRAKMQNKQKREERLRYEEVKK